MRFFESGNNENLPHVVVPSASLIADDPNLLLVNAGMVPFKPFFLGEVTPPYKRDDYMIPAHIVDPVNFGMYTRGVPPVFKKMGYLIDESASNDDKYKILNLMGRQKYYNSNIYEYYVVSSNRDDNIKFDLGKKYRNELFTGDIVKVHQLNKEYKVHIDKNLDYEYNPYVI